LIEAKGKDRRRVKNATETGRQRLPAGDGLFEKLLLCRHVGVVSSISRR